MMPELKFAAQQRAARRLALQHGSGRVLRQARALAALGLVAVLLAGCASAFDSLPHAAGGLPAEAPARPVNQAAYPEVHDMPPARQAPVMSEAEKKQAESDLIALRDKQQRTSAALVKQDQESQDGTSTSVTPAKPGAKPAKKNARPTDPSAGTGRNP